MTPMNNFPSLETEVVCSMVEGIELTKNDIKGAILNNIPFERHDVRRRLIEAALIHVDWDFVENYIKQSINCRELIKVEQ